ncbi:MAG TPA: peptidylprolyl isomerase [Spirochaetales bacterium]|nr:peptidylprolyl isomerase [Spirochaetales bacterium]
MKNLVKHLALGALLCALTLVSPGAQGTDPQGSVPASAGDGVFAVISTMRGTIVLELYADKAPLAVASFVGLTEGGFSASGKPYFDGLLFHRVEPGFVIQGGDPLGNGTGGPGYQFPNEIDSSLGFGSAGVLGMANAGADTNGSQFFITLAPASALNGSYTVFGRVVSGMDAVMAIRKGDAMQSVRIVRRGATALAFKPTKTAFDSAVASYKAKAGERAAAWVKQQTDIASARYSGLKTLPGGIKFISLKAGDGYKPRPGSRVSVLYTLFTHDGKKLDSTADRGNQPFQFVLGAGQVVAGFDAAVADMSYGEKRVVILPPEMAYGKQGVPGAIPADAVLIFEIELVK